MDLPRIRIHDFRHSHASLLIDMGANVLLIAQRLGHQNPQITLKVYAHLFPDKQETIASALNQFSVKPVQTIDTIAP
ncbi:MAG: tyrosine-type recombinase/integrase [Phascolarctobacterium faecium]